MRKQSEGFTLLELMVVIVLIGILLGMVSFTAGNNPARQVRQEAGVLIQLMNTLREQAVLEGREYGVYFETDSYQVFRLNSLGWQSAGTRNRMPEGVQLLLESPEQALVFREHSSKPQVLLLSSDEISPFTLHFETAQQHWLSISSDGLGEPAVDE